jgi:PAS domain-containing protein
LPKAVDIARTLTRRYVLALASLAILATIALVGAEVVISRQFGTAELVNVAGRQRMLSQRAVLFADRLTSAATAQRDDARRELVATLDELARAHAVLSSESSGSLSPALHRIYFEGMDAADPLLTKFVVAGHALAARSAGGPVAPDDPDLKAVDRIGSSRLLAALDSAVSRYETDGEAAIDRVRIFEMVVWLAGLLVLLAAALFIFAPLVRRLQENLAQTNAATAALAESEERFALAAQGSSVGIRDHYNLQQDAEYWSPQLYRLLGYEPGMLTARSSTFNALVHPDDRRRRASRSARGVERRVPVAAQEPVLSLVPPDRPGNLVCGRQAPAPDHLAHGYRRAQAGGANEVAVHLHRRPRAAHPLDVDHGSARFDALEGSGSTF